MPSVKRWRICCAKDDALYLTCFQGEEETKRFELASLALVIEPHPSEGHLSSLTPLLQFFETAGTQTSYNGK